MLPAHYPVTVMGEEAIRLVVERQRVVRAPVHICPDHIAPETYQKHPEHIAAGSEAYFVAAITDFINPTNGIPWFRCVRLSKVSVHRNPIRKKSRLCRRSTKARLELP